MRLTSVVLATLAAVPITTGVAQSAASDSASYKRDSSAWHSWIATPKRYFDPLIADPRAAHQQALVGYSKSPPFLQHQTKQALMWDIDVGAEIPLGGIEKFQGLNGNVADNGWGLGSWFVFDFHMIEDLHDVSNPILNTDYRFSGNFKAQKGLGVGKWLAVKAQVGHESTHLGDEYSLAARRLYPAFQRINVSYQWLDAAVSFDQERGTSLWTVRTGLITTIPFGATYYQGDTLDTNGRVIIESANSVEPYVEAQRRSEPTNWPWGWYASADLRYKTVYNYAKASSADAERRVLSLNAMVGAWPIRGQIGSLGVASPYLRAYYGVNPHGQFRNDPYFWEAGFGLRLDR